MESKINLMSNAKHKVTEPGGVWAWVTVINLIFPQTYSQLSIIMLKIQSVHFKQLFDPVFHLREYGHYGQWGVILFLEANDNLHPESKIPYPGMVPSQTVWG